MKYTSLCLVLTALFCWQCAPVADKNLVANLQQVLETARQKEAGITESYKISVGLVEEITTAPMALQTDSAFVALRTRVNAHTQTHSAVLAEFDDLLSKLQALLTAYQAGTTTTEVVKPEFELLELGLLGAAAQLEPLTEETGQLKVAYDRLLQRTL